MSNKEIVERAQEIKDIAKKSRSKTEQVLVDLRKPTIKKSIIKK